MRIVTNETTKRGMQAISNPIRELTNRGHSVLVIAMAHPADGLKFGAPPFMVDDNVNMLEVLPSKCDVEVMPVYDRDNIAKIIAHYKPDIYLTKGDTGMARDEYICDAAKKMGLRVACLQADSHMYIGNHGWYSDTFMVSGWYWGEYLQSRGVPQSIVVGSVKADYALKYKKNGHPNKIVFFDQMTYSYEQRERILWQLVDIANSMDPFPNPNFSASVNGEIVIKLHPAWKEYRIPLDMLWPDAAIPLISDIDSYELMGQSLVITGFSNTGYEAYYCGSKIVMLNISSYSELYKGCGVDTYSIDTLSEVATKILNDEYNKEQLSEWMSNHYLCDGKSSDRIADYLEIWNG